MNYRFEEKRFLFITHQATLMLSRFDMSQGRLYDIHNVKKICF